jgi:hypothetical protein
MYERKMQMCRCCVQVKDMKPRRPPGNAVPQQLPPVVISCEHTWAPHDYQQRLRTRYSYIEPLRVAPKPYIADTTNQPPAAAVAALAVLRLLLLDRCDIWQGWWQALWLAECGGDEDDALLLTLYAYKHA